MFSYESRFQKEKNEIADWRTTARGCKENSIFRRKGERACFYSKPIPGSQGSTSNQLELQRYDWALSQ